MAEKKEKKYDLVIRHVKEVLKDYTTKLTLRQIYYRLVAREVLKNNRSEYQYLSKKLKIARLTGLISFDIMEDRTRTITTNISTSTIFWKQRVEWKIEEIDDKPYIFKNANALQDIITLIVLEKQALEGIFKEAISNMCILVVCKGYNSVSQLNELAKVLNKANKKIHCYFFSDFDPSGYDIQRNFKESLENDFGIIFDKFERIALNENQIAEYKLPYNPTKTKDPRSSTWKHAGVVEMDALEPNILIDMVKGCVIENYDYELEKWKSKVRKVQQRRSNKMYAKMLIEKANELLENDD